MNKKLNKDQKSSTFTKWLIIGIILSFLIFIFCAVVYICKSLYISKTVVDLACDPFLTKGEIKAFEALQSYYKDSSNFNIMSLLYIFISSVFIGVLGLFVNNQKEKIDNIEKKIDNVEGEIDDFEKNAKKLTDEIIVLENQAKTHEEELQKYSAGIDKIKLQNMLNNALHYLGCAQMLAGNINTLCSTKNTTVENLTEYITRLRDSIAVYLLKENLKKKEVSSLDDNDKKQLTNQLLIIEDLLNFALAKNHPGYDEAIHNEFLGYLESCSQQLENSNI